MNIRLDQITADDVGNQRQKKKSKISKKEVSSVHCIMYSS